MRCGIGAKSDSAQGKRVRRKADFGGEMPVAKMRRKCGQIVADGCWCARQAGAWRKRAKALELVSHCWRACLPAGWRVRWASVSAGLDRGAIERKSRKWYISRGFAERRAGRSAWHSACNRSRWASCADPNWHVYPKGARRVSQRIFAGCGAAGRGILKDPKAEERSLGCARDDKLRRSSKRAGETPAVRKAK